MESRAEKVLVVESDDALRERGLAARPDGIAHGGMELRREQEAKANLVNRVGDNFRLEIQIEAKCLEDIGAAGLA